MKGREEHGRGNQNSSRPQKEAEKEDYSETQYDRWTGYGDRPFKKKGIMSAEDREADKVYYQVDRYLEGRRCEQKYQTQQKQQENEPEKLALNERFGDLKRQMGSMNYMDWMSIPEVQNYSYRRKKREEKYTPIPDSIIDQARKSNQHDNQVTEGPETLDHYNSLGKARNSVLSYNLAKATENTFTHKSVDKTGYMTMLDEKKVATMSEVADM